MIFTTKKYNNLLQRTGVSDEDIPKIVNKEQNSEIEESEEVYFLSRNRGREDDLGFLEVTDNM